MSPDSLPDVFAMHVAEHSIGSLPLKELVRGLLLTANPVGDLLGAYHHLVRTYTARFQVAQLHTTSTRNVSEGLSNRVLPASM